MRVYFKFNVVYNVVFSEYVTYNLITDVLGYMYISLNVQNLMSRCLFVICYNPGLEFVYMPYSLRFITFLDDDSVFKIQQCT